MKWLFSPPSLDDFLRLLRAWKFWLLFSILGALLGVGAYYAFPPDYRAQATVVVDFNIEESWTYGADRDVYYYLERESRKLVEVAWADETVAAVAEEMGDITVAELRNERLHLSQPQDGGWHFYADDADSARAEKMVVLWAESFVENAREGATNATALKALTTSIENGIVEFASVEAELARLEAGSSGITSYVEVSLSQKESLPITRTNSLGEYLAFGAAAMLFLATLWVLFTGKMNG
ncbi:MAG: hypothetical protein HN855_08980 [Anaerolineae bacterium]|jgi:hypothetical protein|nr:hypothetical protein [Anaerolineae bacterium]MBT7072999.1 hypothetical protein [Anaerolineae bacterium]MBT7325279.1 hypothetical protein [Anaerolineae bacterium]